MAVCTWFICGAALAQIGGYKSCPDTFLLPCFAVERLVEYHTQPEEAPAFIEPRPPGNWPQAGAVQAVQLVVKYRPELRPVLQGISFSINPGEKIGICGRTGMQGCVCHIMVCQVTRHAYDTAGP